ncbi:MAG: phenol 2-monooxygenase, partial [Methyloversatilis sp.]|nr:phenol 2-monooxygenase [Methyloversatilis sp.]
MDMQVPKKKLGLKERYTLMTRDLAWDTTYQPKEKVYPYADYEGIKIHDWDKWEDPFRLTMDAYWKYQAEKERKLYAIIDAYSQSNGHLGVTDARYLNAIKIFLTAVTPLEYMAHRGFAHVGRAFPGAGARVACQMQAIDEMRHAQTQIHSLSNYNKYYNGFHDAPHMFDRVWYLSVPKSFFDDAITAGPFEFIVSVGFSFEYVLTNLLFVPFVSGAAYNGDMGTMTFGFSTQSDEARHMTLGLECIKFILEQDPANLPIVQRWIDKWCWRGVRLLSIVAMMMDYMLPKRVMSWKEAWEVYFEENGGALFKDLARYGIKMPACAEQIRQEKDHLSHQVWATFYNYGGATDFHTWMPTEDEMQWLSQKYPDTFDKYYRPRFEFWREQQEKGNRFYNKTLPMLCQTCQIPMLFTEPGDPTKICYRERTYKDNK